MAMNERMREPFHTLMWKASIGYNDSWSQVDPEVLEKFAELIVDKCLEACDKANEIRYFVPPNQEQVVYSCMREIERHFGVEV
jgi:hypothetical protein